MASPQNGHIVKAYDTQLTQLSRRIAEMGGLAETQLTDALAAMSRRDSELAAQVIAADAAVDALERAIDQEAIQLLALRQPMADDLREVVASLKVANILERVADYAANVAKRSTALNQLPQVEPIRSVPRMGRLVVLMIHDVLNAYDAHNAEQALEIWQRDKEVDELYDSLFRELLTYMMEDPRNITACTHLLFIAKNIERIGDYTTNVAEIVYFLVTGNPIGESRPKADTTSFAIVNPPTTTLETTIPEPTDSK